MSLKVVHINRDQPKVDKAVKELADRLRQKWEARDIAEVQKVCPNYRPDKKENQSA